MRENTRGQRAKIVIGKFRLASGCVRAKDYFELLPHGLLIRMTGEGAGLRTGR